MLEEHNFVLFDAQGRQDGLWHGLQPPFYQAVPIPYCTIQKSKIFCTPCDAVQEKANNDNLTYSVTYMAQSAAGRAAIQTLSGNGIGDNHIRIGYNENFQRKNMPQAGYRDGVPYILVDPATPPALQHLVLIQQAAQFAATLQLTARPVAALPQAAQLIGQASVICGLVALLDHGEECLANRRENPQRFVPPELDIWMDRISSSPAVQVAGIPRPSELRAAYRQRLLEALGPKTSEPGFEKPSPP